MKQFLCLKNNQTWYRDFKIGKIYTGDEGVIEDDDGCDWRTEELLEDGVIKPIETFEKDGHTWIRHGGGGCPVPGVWIIQTISSTGPHRANWWNWDSCQWGENDYGYRIISTGELSTTPDYGAKIKADVSESGYCVEFTFEDNKWKTLDSKPVSDVDVLHLTQQEFKRHSDRVLGCLEDMLHKEKDSRPLSPQEAAYAAKIAALQPEPEAPRVFPAPALRDMTDKTFASLLGMGQFIGGGE